MFLLPVIGLILPKTPREAIFFITSTPIFVEAPTCIPPPAGTAPNGGIPIPASGAEPAEIGPSPPSPFSGESEDSERSSSSTSPSVILSSIDASGTIFIV